MPIVMLIIAGVVLYFLETDNGHQRVSYDGSDSVDRNGSNQPGGLPQENRERLTEQEKEPVTVPETTNKKE